MKHLVCVAALSVCAVSAWAAKPAHYVASLTSDGNQGIVLPIKGSTNLTVEAQVRWLNPNAAYEYTLLGCEDQTDSKKIVAYAPMAFSFSRRWAYRYGTNACVKCANNDKEPSSALCTIRAVMKDGCQQFFWDGVQQGETGVVTNQCNIDVPLGLFGRYIKDSKGKFSFYRKMQYTLYYLRIYGENDELVFDGRPCLDDYGIAALYDVVSDTILYNSETGSLVPGPIMDDGVPISFYISPGGNGLKHGQGWENAAPFSVFVDVLNACKAHPWGGTVRLKEGVYRPASGASYELSANLKLIGGYAGTADDEVPDPAAHPTIFSGTDGTIMWSANGTGHSVGVAIVDTSAVKINLPPADDYPSTTAWYPSAAGNGYSFSVGGSTAATNMTVANIQFACDAALPLSITSTCADGTVVSNCVFAGCAPSTRNSTCDLGNSPILMTDCTFLGNGTPVRLMGTDRASLIQVRNCAFKYNHHPHSQYDDRNSSGIAICGNSEILVDRCLFHANVSSLTSGSSYGAALYVGSGTSAPILVRDSVFSNNYATGKAEGIVLLGNGRGTVKIDGCRFYGNFGRPCLKTASHKNALMVWNSLFVNNANDAGTAIFSCYRQDRLSIGFVNCEFLSNRSTACSMMNLETPGFPSHLSLVNCLFLNNDVFASGGTTRLPDVNWNRQGYTTQNSAAFVNTIFAHTNKDYVALTPYADEIHANSYLQGTNVSSLVASGKGWHADDLTAVAGAPDLAKSPVVCANGNAFDILDADSPIRRRGRKVYLGADGYCYLYHEAVGKTAARWQSLQTDYNYALKYLTLAEGEALGLDVNNPSIADARGKARPRKVSPGPVDFGVPGMVLLVR